MAEKGVAHARAVSDSEFLYHLTAETSLPEVGICAAGRTQVVFKELQRLFVDCENAFFDPFAVGWSVPERFYFYSSLACKVRYRLLKIHVLVMHCEGKN